MTEQTPIGQLMARDPLKHTQADIEHIVAELRKQRHQFVVRDDKTIGKPDARKSAAQKKREANAEALKDLDLNDLLSGL